MADGSNRPTYGPHPDAVLRLRRLTQRATAAVRLALAMQAPLKPKKTEPKARRCPMCRTVYSPVGDHFGKSRTRKYCMACNPMPAAKPKTCNVCGVTHPETERYFRRGGKVHANCNPCAEAAVRAKIEARIARKANKQGVIDAR